MNLLLFCLVGIFPAELAWLNAISVLVIMIKNLLDLLMKKMRLVPAIWCALFILACSPGMQVESPVPTITSIPTIAIQPISAQASSSSLTQTHEPPKEITFTDKGRVMYIDNGVVKVGIDKNWGGAIREIWFEGRNLVNNWDGGRLIAVSLYDGDSKTGFNAGDAGWGWNPCPSDKHDNTNKPISYSFKDQTLYIKTRYLEWNPDNKGGGKGRPITTDVIVETWINFVQDDPQAIQVKYNLTHNGKEDHALAGQEMGFAYIRIPTNRFVLYSGTSPWTNAAPTFETQSPFPKMGNSAASEQWAGYVDSNDVGLLVWAPQSYPIYSHVFFDNAQGNRQENSTYYMSARAYFAIGPGSKKEMNFYFFAGRWQDARALFHRLDQEVNLPDVMQPMGYLDSPTQGRTVSSMFDISGWAIDDRKDLGIEVYLDGKRLGQANYGLSRGDVARDYPGLPGTPNFGFVYHLDTSLFKNGRHVLDVRAFDQAGNFSFLKPGKVTININN